MPGTVSTPESNVLQQVSVLGSSATEISRRTRVHIAWRILPFVALLYLIQIIDRFNVSFAALRMKTDLGFSDSVYGFSASVLVFAYATLAIPGVILIERWSARKWITGIMVFWGLVTVLTAFIHTALQFYLVRFFLGAAEASFFPGMIVFLTHWFTAKDRARAVAGFYVAAPIGMFVGSAVAGWLLNVHWLGLSSWRWLFIVEGIPAVLFGLITLFYLTDRPPQAKWLPEDERSWITDTLAGELAAKNSRGRLSLLDACKDARMLLLIASFFFFLMGSITSAFWIPTFVQRLSNLQPATIARYLMLASIGGVLGVFLFSWSADRTREYKWHSIVCMFGAGCSYLFLTPAAGHLPLMFLLFWLYYFFSQSTYPIFWALPTTFLSETTAAAVIGIISSIGGLGSFLGPSIVGRLNDRTHSIHPSLFFLGGSFIMSALILSFLRTTPSTPLKS
jgi:MFS transporter, ACS family, tartrate transporter